MFLNAQHDNKVMGRYFFNAKCYIGKIVGMWGISKTAHTLTVSTRSGFNSAARKFSSLSYKIPSVELKLQSSRRLSTAHLE